jgi:hypothetical protein
MITTNANTTVLFQNHMKLGVIYLQKYSESLYRKDMSLTDEIGANFSLTYHEVDRYTRYNKILSYNIIIQS